MQSRSSASLSTLATVTAQLLASPVMTRGGGIQTVKCAMAIFGISNGDGPWLTGLSRKDLSLAELEEYLENAGPVNPDDTTASKRSTRGKHIRVLGLLIPSAAGLVAGRYFRDVPLKGLRFSETSAGWNHWLYNIGQTMTTGAT